MKPIKSLLSFCASVFITLLITTICNVQVHADRFTWGNYSEYINKFDSVVEVQENSDLIVTETITVTTVNNRLIKHGIYRDFPILYKDGAFMQVRSFDILGVSLDGKYVKSHTTGIDNGIRLYLGDEDVLISPGKYTYVIKYRTNQQLGFLKDNDELYFNINGTEWDFPIVELNAKIIFPKLIDHSKITADAFTGAKGETNKDFVASISDESGKTVVTYKTTRSLAINDCLTTKLSFPKEVIKEPNFIQKSVWFAYSNMAFLITCFALIWAFCTAIPYWYLKGRDPKQKTIIPDTKIPADLSPAQVRYLYNMGTDDSCLTASVLNLAVKGKLSISEDHGVYSLNQILPENNAEISAEERTYLSALFSKTRKTVMLKYDPTRTLYRAYQAYKISIDLFNKGNKYIDAGFWNWFFICFTPFILGIIASCLAIALQSQFNYMFVLIGLLSWLGIVKAIQYAVKTIKTVLRAEIKLKSVFTLASAIIGTIITFLILPVLTFAALYMAPNPEQTLLVILCSYSTGTLLIWMYSAMKRRSVLGRELTDKILGLRMFMETADRERFRILIPQLPLNTNTNESNVDSSIMRLKLFEYYLPYAVALEVERKWSQNFTSELETLDPNSQSLSWYAHTSAFTSSGLASSLSSGLSSSISSSGGSSSSGGGSSGGGGGGGGGGGW